MNIEFLCKELINEKLLSEIIYFEKLDSTNGYAKINNLSENTLLVTDRQTSGNGRFNRKWNSTPGKDLTFTLIKNFKLSIDEIHLVNFYTSYIIFLTIKNIIPENSDCRLFLKWPNDLLLNRKKISGILTDVQDLRSDKKKFIIGAGININSGSIIEEIKNIATSIKIETGNEIDLSLLLRDLILNYYDKIPLINNGKQLISKWKENTDIIGKNIRFSKLNDGEGIRMNVIDIDTDGGLIVSDTENSVKKFNSGEIKILSE